jgi:hypothetical protein
LRTTLAEALEFNRAEARDAAGKGYEELLIAEHSAIPRHNEINNYLARKICHDLGIPEPPRF